MAQLHGKGESKALDQLKTIEFLGGISNKKLDLLKKGWEQKKCHSLAT